MKRKYIQPQVCVRSIALQQMIAESLNVNNGTTNQMLSKDNDLEIWEWDWD